MTFPTIPSVRHGFTALEILIVASILAGIVGILSILMVNSSASTGRTEDVTDALRSALLAAEAFRGDVSRMVFQNPGKDLAIMDNGRKVSLKVPRQFSSNYWEMWHDPVTFSLTPVPNHPQLFRILRQTTGGASPIAGCVVKEWAVRYIPPDPQSADNGYSAFQGYLELLVVGGSLSSDKASYALTCLTPLSLMKMPGPYLWTGR